MDKLNNNSIDINNNTKVSQNPYLKLSPLVNREADSYTNKRNGATKSQTKESLNLPSIIQVLPEFFNADPTRSKPVFNEEANERGQIKNLKTKTQSPINPDTTCNINHQALKSHFSSHTLKLSLQDSNDPSSSPSSSCFKGSFRNFVIQMGNRATSLTSNQYGTASADRFHHGAVMQNIMILSTQGLMDNFPNYRPIVNNKLKSLKFCEFLQDMITANNNKSPEGNTEIFRNTADSAFFHAITSAGPSSAKIQVLRQGSTFSCAVYRSGQRIFPTEPVDVQKFWNFKAEGISDQLNFKEFEPGKFEIGDAFVICRGFEGCINKIDGLAAELDAKVPPGQDLDEIVSRFCVMDSGSTDEEEKCMVLGVFDDTFDSHWHKKAAFSLKHVAHVEKSGYLSHDTPWPYAITKHTLVLRSYLALLYSDASKINRFSPTIEFIIKKAAAGVLGSDIKTYLKKLSDVEHMAGALILGNRLRYWSTNGAVLALVVPCTLPDSRPSSITFPGVRNWKDVNESIPLGETEITPQSLLLLLSPSVRMAWSPAELIQILQFNDNWNEKLSCISDRLPDASKCSKNGIGLFTFAPR